MLMFNYAAGTADFNDIIEENFALASAAFNGTTIANREERLHNLNTSIATYLVDGTKAQKFFDADGLAAFKNPSVIKNKEVQANFDTLIAQMINPILPMITNNDFMSIFAESRQVGWGDNAKFVIKSNELYKVNEIAQGVNRGVLQPIHNDEVTVDTSPIEIAFEADWYAMAAGVYDWGTETLRAAKSFENYIFLKVLGALTSGVTALGAAYSATGFSDANWTGLAQKTSAANGGSDVYAVGTLTALGAVVPATAGLQYGLGQKIADDGHLDRYRGVRLIVADQAMTYNSVNTTADLILPDNKIYFVPVSALDKPVKVVYEGNTLYAERMPDHTPDRTYRVRIRFSIGVAAIVGSKFGTLTIGG